MARKVSDILLTNDFDLQVVGGDLVVGDSSNQHQQLLLLTEPGQIEQYPLTGCGILTWLLDDDSNVNNLRHIIERNFTSDGLRINTLQLNDLPTIKLNANYE